MNKFPIGTVVMTPAVAQFFATHPRGVVAQLSMLQRHASGDWGSVSEADKEENDLSVENGYRILSAYHDNGKKIWLITEADRSVTTFLFPEEY